ncbi:BatD family protein [Ascidiimonas sp. W6]|uniref:BatD family protein n=1 Tax=Ascidiimonas meishanensis TaxID=3128903 RepID=UPI0030EDACC8
MFFFLIGSISIAQITPRIKTSIDSTTIKIGEQINYQINVEIDTTAQVVFPETKLFGALEVIESFETDTIPGLDKYRLIKKYGLTQFDSGNYTIPKLKVLINNKTYLTDSLTVRVNDIAVDTTQQKMYDIKPIVKVTKSYSDWWKYVLGILAFLGIVGALIYWFVFRKKPMSEEEKVALLPPFDRAMMELKKLEESKYLIQSEYKQYYSELTEIVRAYLEEDVHISALESTTDELITKIELLKDSGNLKIEDDTINSFKRILQTADLVKFARSKPEMKTADADRKAIEEIVIKTKEAIPEPTEEELQQTQEYQEELERKKKRKKILIVSILGACLIFISAGIFSAYYGFAYVKDTVLGHPTKELLEGEWIASDYGFPIVSVNTPKVLVRQSIPIPPEAKAMLKEMQFFAYQSRIGLFSIAVGSTTYNDGVELNMQGAIDGALQNMEKGGATNLVTKQEEFVTANGIKGIKTFGSGKFKVPETGEMLKGKYVLLVFGGKNFQQNVIITWKEDDSYADEIVERVLRSVEVKTE